jgi:hypothetical protein
MVENETTIGKVATLIAKLLSGWRVPTLKDAIALAAYVFARARHGEQSK